MGKTEIYGLEYLEPYLDTQTVIDADEHRFRTIESQTYALYSIFGNGVIVNQDSTSAGWEIQESINSTTDAPKVSVTAGRGHVSYMAGYTSANTDVDLTIPDGSIYPIKFYIYAIKNNTTPYTGTVDFVASTVVITDPSNYIGLGAVSVNSYNGVLSYEFYNNSDNGRVEISLFSTVGTIINKHKHIGGNYNPPPINLSAHVQGKLSGDNITNIDLSTVTKGTLAPERLPQIDHSTLSRRGILTHPQIDTLLTSLTGGNTEGRLSDLTTTNMLQLALALKRTLSMDIDINLINALLFIPGLNSASGFFDRYFANYENSNYNVLSAFVPREIILANFDPINHLIAGTTSGGTTSSSLTWSTYFDFITAKDTTENNSGDIDLNVIYTSASGVTDAYIELAKPLNYLSAATEDMTNWDWSYLVNDNAVVDSVSDPDIFKDNYNLARFFYLQYSTITPSQPKRDINGTSNVDFFYGLPSVNGQVSHPGNIYFYLMFSKSYNTDTQTYVLNDKTIYTSKLVKFRSYTDDPIYDMQGYSIPLSSFGVMASDQKKDIIGIGIAYLSDSGEYWDKNEVWFEWFSPTLDKIEDTRVVSYRQSTGDLSSVYFWNKNLYESEETIRFRFNSGYSNTLYQNIYASTEKVQGITDIIISTVIANSTTELDISPAENIGSNGEIRSASIQNNRKYIDIIVKFTTNDLLQSPKLLTLTLIYSGPGASQSPKIWDIGKEWYEGELDNIDVHNLPILVDERRPAKIYVDDACAILGTDPVVLTTPEYNTANEITLDYNDRVVVNQSVNKEYNGIYYVSEIDTGVAQLQRDTDANNSAYFENQFFITINSGADSYIGKTFNLVAPISNLNSDAIEFELYSNKNYLTIKTSEIEKIGQYTFLKNNNAYYSSDDFHDYVKADNLYLSPYQVFNRLGPGFISPRYMTTLSSGNVIVVDTDNDRIVELTQQNELVKAIQGNIRLPQIDRDFVILSSVYNPTLGKMWIMFSQYVNAAVDKNMISIGNGTDAIVFSSTDTVTNTSVNVVPLTNTSTNSATLLITFPSTFIERINGWITAGNTIKLTINSSAVSCDGSDLTNQTASTGGATSTYPDISPYLAGPPAKFTYLGKSGYVLFPDLDSTLGQIDRIPIDGGFLEIPSESTAIVDNADYNGDNEISNSASATLMGLDTNTGLITIDVTVGNIIVDNVYSPLYVQYINTGWLISCVGEYNVVFYNSALAQVWNIPASYVGFRNGINSSAYQISSGYIVAALPAPIDATSETANGEVIILNRNAGTQANPKIAVINRIPINRGDAIRAIPDATEMNFWVAVNDRVGDGLKSRIIKINYIGETLWSWNGSVTNSRIYSPTDLKILDNNTILVSE